MEQSAVAQRIVRDSRMVARGCAVAALATGVSCLAGWAFEVAALRSVLPGLVEMKPNTALGLALLGAALGLLVRGDCTTRDIGVARGCAAIMAAAGALTLAEYAAGWDLGIDQWLVREPPGAVGTAYAGRMAPTTAVNFVLLGGAMLAMGAGERRIWLAQWMALLVGMMSALVMLGHLYGVEGFYAIGRATPMAVHTAGAFLALGVGVLLARHDRGVMAALASGRIGGVVARRFLPLAMGVPVAAGWLVLRGETAGFYGREFTVALLVAGTMGILGAVIWAYAGSLNRSDEERERAVARAQVSESRARRLVESNIIGAIVADFEGNILEANDAFLKLTGYSRQDLVAGGVRWDQMTPPEHHAADVRAIGQLHATGVVAPWEKEYSRKDGRRVPVLVGAAMLGPAARECVAFILDLTEQKQAEAALKRAAAELARSNAELERFAYVASHHLQEPLRMIGSYTQLLAQRYRGRLDGDADEFIAYAVGGAGRLRQMINDLLDYARVEQRGKPPAATDAGAVLARVLRGLGDWIRQHNARLTHDPLPTVQADPRQLAQALWHLIHNAVKFHGPEPPQVHIGAMRGAGHWVFHVRDNGIGIAPEYAGRVFGVFQRLHGPETYPGTGIGLALCKRIIERHGGRIWVESRPGGGATFYFTLPAAEAAPA